MSRDRPRRCRSDGKGPRRCFRPRGAAAPSRDNPTGSLRGSPARRRCAARGADRPPAAVRRTD
ncbi:MAG: hypothetical protein GC155_00560 [Alphaproteobacteria bacterium]|nr:hypothetical protein [Alphaproteobacteria bacterium]